MPDSDSPNRVPVERLRWHLAPDVGEFRSTADLEPTDEIIGQDAAVEAIRTGLELESYGYNIFITGLVGTGRLTVVRRLLKELLDERGDAPAHDGLHDLCYVHNFDAPDLPRLLVLDKGQGASLAAAMDVFIDALENELPQIFESDEYETERKELVQRFRQQQSELIDAFQAKVQAEGFALVQVQMGPIARPDVTPTLDGKPVGFDQLEALKAEGKMTDEQLEAIREKHEALVEELGSVAKQMRSVEREVRARVRAFDRDVVKVALDDLLGDIRAKFEHRRIRTFLAEVERDVLKNPDRFRREDPSEEEEDDGDPNRFYRVNVIVDNRNTKRPPSSSRRTPATGICSGRSRGVRRTSPSAVPTSRTCVRDPSSVRTADTSS